MILRTARFSWSVVGGRARVLHLAGGVAAEIAGQSHRPFVYMPLGDSGSAGVTPQTVRGRHGSCSCASQTSSGSSARTRSWPSVCGSSSSPNHTTTSPPTTTRHPPRPAAPDDARAPAGLDHDHLHAACVARRRDESEPRKQLELAVDRHVLHAGRVDPLENGVVILAARVLQLPTLHVDRLTGEEVVAAAVVEVQVSADDDV